MQPSLAISSKISSKDLPHSKMVYPSMTIDRAKYFFWTFYTPCHPFLRDLLISLGILAHDTRQDFLLGKLHPDRSVEDFLSFLIGRGYGNHFIAWKDRGEIISLRYVVNFVRQYHIRLFEDGEIRGHYEYTPECRPILHLREVGMEDRSDELKELLRGWIV